MDAGQSLEERVAAALRSIGNERPTAFRPDLSWTPSPDDVRDLIAALRSEGLYLVTREKMIAALADLAHDWGLADADPTIRARVEREGDAILERLSDGD